MNDSINNTLTQNERDEVFSTLASIIAIPSVKGEAMPDAPYGIHTRKALDYMLDLGSQNGFTVKNLDGRVGYIEWGSGADILGLLCHLDVVPAKDGWKQDPFSLRRENGRLIGRGINDDKGPAVTLFFAMLRLKKSGYIPPCRIRLILGLDEESGSTCMEHYVKTEELPTCGFTPDANFPAIYAEKGILQIKITGPGSDRISVVAGERPNMVPARCLLTVQNPYQKIDGIGVAAHASRPNLGINAIYEAFSRLDPSILSNEPLPTFFMDQIAKDTTGEKLINEHIEDISGALTLNAGMMLINSANSELLIDIRYPVTADSNKIIKAITNCAAIYNLSTEVYSHQKPLFLDPQKTLIQSLISVYEKYVKLAPFDPTEDLDLWKCAINQPAAPIAIGGGTYARSMPGLVAFGPAFPWEKDQAHQVNESMNEEIVYMLVMLYQDAIVALCENMQI